MIKIRGVQFSDNFEALQWLHERTFPHDMADLPAEGHWWIAYDGSAPVGFAGLVKAKSIKNAGFLHRVGVVKPARGQGLQKRFIRIRLRKASDLGWGKVITYTHPANYASSNSLAACGFRLYDPYCNGLTDNFLHWCKTL